MRTRLFVVVFGGEVMGFLSGKTMAGTAKRYATNAGLHPDDADLKLIDVTGGISQELQKAAELAGTIKLAK